MTTTPKTLLNGVLIWTVAIAALVCVIQPVRAKTSERQRRIVLIAGSKSPGPGMHEYLTSARLLKVLLDRAPGLKNAPTEVVYDGWPSKRLRSRHC
jgi:hypothetical protein